MPYKIKPPYYPIVYVRGYAMRRSDIAETFYDTYYGFAASAVYKKQAAKDDGYIVPDMFEGQLIRFMKKYSYTDSVNGLKEDFDETGRPEANPFQTIWVSRFYDVDFIQDKVRPIEFHARELAELIINKIPARLRDFGADEADLKENYKVILMAHSMGGLVCRTLLQNILPEKDYNCGAGCLLDSDKLKNPEQLIHRLITIGTPHKGIDLGNIPDFIENALTATLNPFDSNMFKPLRMRDYLMLGDKKDGRKKKDNDEDDFQYDLHSLGNSSFPANKCLCIIGSDYHSYSVAQYLTGSFSDGLVKQDRAYIVSGAKPAEHEKYTEQNTAYYANIHRAHSGYQGIVNSSESFENIQRFLFGNLKVRVSLTGITFNPDIKPDDKCDYQYDFEFSLSVKGAGVYLHQRQQDPCENAIRYSRDELTAPGAPDIFLHNGFLDSNLQRSGDGNSYFIMRFKIAEYKILHGRLWDTDYPARTIYSETIEVKVAHDGQVKDGYQAQYSWLSNSDNWQDFAGENGQYSIPLQADVSTIGTAAVTGKILLQPSFWDNKE